MKKFLKLKHKLYLIILIFFLGLINVHSSYDLSNHFIYCISPDLEYGLIQNNTVTKSNNYKLVKFNDLNNFGNYNILSEINLNYSSNGTDVACSFNNKNNLLTFLIPFFSNTSLIQYDIFDKYNPIFLSKVNGTSASTSIHTNIIFFDNGNKLLLHNGQRVKLYNLTTPYLTSSILLDSNDNINPYYETLTISELRPIFFLPDLSGYITNYTKSIYKFIEPLNFDTLVFFKNSTIPNGSVYYVSSFFEYGFQNLFFGENNNNNRVSIYKNKIDYDFGDYENTSIIQKTCKNVPVGYSTTNDIIPFGTGTVIKDNYSSDISEYYEFGYSGTTTPNYSFFIENVEHVNNLTGSLFGIGYLSFDSLENPFDFEPKIKIEALNGKKGFDRFSVSGSGTKIEFFNERTGTYEEIEYNTHYKINNDYYNYNNSQKELIFEFKKSYFKDNNIQIIAGTYEVFTEDLELCKYEDGTHTLNGNPYTGNTEEIFIDYAGGDAIYMPDSFNFGDLDYSTGGVDSSISTSYNYQYGLGNVGDKCKMFTDDGTFSISGNGLTFINFVEKINENLGPFSETPILKEILFIPIKIVGYVVKPFNNIIGFLSMLGPTSEGKYCYFGNVVDIKYQKLILEGENLYEGIVNDIEPGITILDYIFLFIFCTPLAFAFFYTLRF